MGRFERISPPTLIFVTGGTTLALEVIASRIMTPYFGVSLYIWASILATTLAFLAVGYAFGGALANRLSSTACVRWFFLAPILGAGATVVAGAIYPVAFRPLAQFDLIIGNFLASTILLAIPLVLFSAMNPLLIAMGRSDREKAGGAAGRVFFISTLGSVSGVLVTAFAIIPFFTNFRALLGLSVMVAALSWLLSPRCLKRWLLLPALLVCLGAVGLSQSIDPYLRWANPSDQAEPRALIDESTSIFGNLKVVDVRDSRGRRVERRLLQDGLVQNRIGPNGESLSPYTDALLALSLRYRADAAEVLILGLGAGVVVQGLARHPMESRRQITAVEINPDAYALAVKHFGLAIEAPRVNVVIEDARTYVSRCTARPQLVVVDLFQGDYAPDYLFTREFFASLRRCADPDVVLVMNTFLPETGRATRRLLATVLEPFGHVRLHRMPLGNAFVVAGTHPLRARPVAVDLQLTEFPSLIRKTLERVEPVDAKTVGDLPGFTDDRNDFSVEFAPQMMANRRDYLDSASLRDLLN
ncbi:MAG: fused MFS/spermidine synthase [Pseudomonadota bacterium]